MINWRATLIWAGIGACALLVLLFVTPQLGAIGASKFGPFKPRIVDGDTLADGDRVFRIAGVDTCEKTQPAWFPDYEGPIDCGAYASAFVSRFIGNREVVCYDQGSRTYGRIVARCYVDDGWPTLENDIGAFALRSGWAVNTNYADLSYGVAYKLISLRAQVSRNGLWNAKVENPADWRHQEK